MKNFYGNRWISTLNLLVLIFTFFVCLIDHRNLLLQMPMTGYGFLLVWLLGSILFSLLSFKEFTVGYLLCIFCMLIAWRIGGIYNVVLVVYPLIPSFVLLLLDFLYCAYINLKKPQLFRHKVSIEGWQLIFIRMYIGFDFIPHFTEKLFAGSLPHQHLVAAFAQLKVPHADLFVWLAGFCELGAAIALSLGFITSLGAIGAALYLLIATYLGHHFFLGFIWAAPGGGWEFSAMWIILILSFVFTGGRQFSIDQRLLDKFKIPRFIKILM